MHKTKAAPMGAAFSAKQLVRRIQNQLFTTFIYEAGYG
jgi:hypothetical protein